MLLHRNYITPHIHRHRSCHRNRHTNRHRHRDSYRRHHCHCHRNRHRHRHCHCNCHGHRRVEIFRDRHDRRSRKMCASCVKFPGKQCNFSHNLPKTTRFTHTKCDFALKLLKFYTLS